MNKRDLEILGRAYVAEINAAFTKGPGLLATRSKVAERLEREGYLERRTIQFGSLPTVTITGYVLTHLGRFTYCSGSTICAD
jgi:hypothetical protein